VAAGAAADNEKLAVSVSAAGLMAQLLMHSREVEDVVVCLPLPCSLVCCGCACCGPFHPFCCNVFARFFPDGSFGIWSLRVVIAQVFSADLSCGPWWPHQLQPIALG